jgi:hypothetical protein
MPISTRATQVMKDVISDPSTSVEVLAFFNNPASLGLVTSVGLVAPAELTVSGSPVTGASNITLAWANQSANTFFAGPATGVAATPGFRALAVADIPVLPYSKVSGLANDLSGKAPIDSPTFQTVVNLGEGVNLALGGGSGSKIGTSTLQKIGFYNSTPIIQPTGNLFTALGVTGLGLVASPSLAVADVTGAAPLASPTFTGTPAAPTAATGDSSTQLATTAFVSNSFQILPLSITGTTSLPSSSLGTYPATKWHVCTGTAANYTVTLPSPTNNAGKTIGFIMSSALTKLVTISRNSGETIDGAASRVMWAQETALLYTDGTNWTKIQGKSRQMFCQMGYSTTAPVTSGTVTVIPLDSIYIDNTSLMASTAASRVNVLRPGNYTASAFGTFVAMPAESVNTQVRVRRTGLLADDALVSMYCKTGSDITQYVSGVYENNTTSDYFQLASFQSCGTNGTFSGVTSRFANLTVKENTTW